MKQMYFLLCIACTTCFQLVSTEAPRKIVVSQPAKIDTFPHQAAFEYDGKFKFGATIISVTQLMSAAHFFTLYKNYVTHGAIRTGTLKKENGGSVFNITNVILHPDYSSDMFANDLALIWLKTPIKFNQMQKAIAFPKPYNYDLLGKKMLFSGFGQIEGAGSSNVLKSAVLTVISYKECHKTFQDLEPHQEIFCTTEGPCNGDVGGAVTLKNQLYGIISNAEGCFFPNQSHPTIVTKVQFYYVWLTKYVLLKI